MRLSVIFFEGSWVTLSSWVWFWHDFPEGVRSLEKQNLQFILANAFSSSELKKVYGIDGVPRNLVGMLLEQRGTKLCQRFSFLFLLLCFCFCLLCLFCFLFLIICLLNANIFLLEAAECKFILKKLIWFQGNADNSSKIGFLWLKLCSYFSREVMFDTLSYRRKSVPPCSSSPFCWLPSGQGRNQKIAYSLNLQTSSLLHSVWCFLYKDFLRIRLIRRWLNLGKVIQRIPHETTLLLGQVILLSHTL